MKFIGMTALVGLLAGLMPATGLAAPAAQSNLLANPGLEQPYENGKQANGWGRWFENTGKKSGTLDYAVQPEFIPEVNAAIVRSGSTSQHIGNEYDPWHAGVKQAVAVPAGTPLKFCAWGRLFANNEDFEKGPSVPGLNGHMRVGIFPNGDADWDNGGIVWSGEANPHDFWQEICVTATAGDAGKVTVFTSTNYGGSTAYHLDAWWDDASLVTTAPPATAGPTPAPTVPFVAAAPVVCETQPDGSVTYVVQSGDTLGAIALACDTSVEAIQQLNGLTGTLISVGQSLIIKGPTAPPTATPTVAPAATEIATAPPTGQLTTAPIDGSICVEAFNDANSNRTKDAGEQLLGGVGFTLSDSAGPKGSYITDGLESAAYCFAGLLPGSYTIEARAPVGVASTTDAQWPVGLTAGMKFDIAYGGSRNAGALNVPAGADPTAAPDTTDAAPPPTAASSSTSDLGRIFAGLLGVVILLGAGAMASIVWARARR
jgi:LysM repeat protein